MVCGLTRISAKATSSGTPKLRKCASMVIGTPSSRPAGVKGLVGCGGGSTFAMPLTRPSVGRQSAHAAASLRCDTCARCGCRSSSATFAEAEFVDGIGVDVHGEIVAVGRDQGAIEDGGRSAESSWIFTPERAAATDSSTAPTSMQPRPRKPKLSGNFRRASANQLAEYFRSEQLTSKCGPGDMPIMVVVAAGSA